MIERLVDVERLQLQLAQAPVVLLVGARQSGKTTLARALVAPGSANYFDLENDLDLRRLDEPMIALEQLSGLVVIDEVQRRPELFPILRVLVDRRPRPATFLILGSAQPAALQQASESLTGRISVMELGGIQLGDVGVEERDGLWLRGGFPLAHTAKTDAAAFDWLGDYVRNLVERDLLALNVRLPATALRRFLGITAHYSGQVWSSADPARSLGISEHTVRRYLDLLTDALIVRQLPPWHANVAKRQVRSPKTFVRDSGLAHRLLGITTWEGLLRHPSAGATWEGWVIETLLHLLRPDESFFWRTHDGAELDLLMSISGRWIGVEVKRADAPRMTPSMRSALTDLELDRLVVIYPGDRRYRLNDKVEVVPVSVLADHAETLAVLG
jgi:uncharacterized protein